VSSKFLNMREVYAAVGDTVGPDFPLMADPAAAYSFEKAMQVGRVLESLDHRRFEEPFYEYDIQSDIRLRQKPDIPIAGTETIAARRHSA
jgi:L-alanine-DL-glutamate epimerase-like enolase superfamily enzyme